MVNVEETFALVRILDAAEFRDLSPTYTKQRYDTASWLQERGIDSRALQMLWLYAKQMGKNPNSLFAFWLGNPSRTEKKIREAIGKPAFVKKAKEAMRLQDAPAAAAPIYRIRKGG